MNTLPEHSCDVLIIGSMATCLTRTSETVRQWEELLSDSGTERRSIRCVNYVVYEDTEELREALTGSGADVIIGATHATEVGKQLGIRTVLIYPSFSCILDTFAEAKNLARELEKERKKNQYINALLQCSVNGIFLVDSLCRVIDFNQKAADLAGVEREKLKYSYLDQIFPKLKMNEFVWGSQQESLKIVKLENKEIVCNIVLLVHGILKTQ